MMMMMMMMMMGLGSVNNINAPNETAEYCYATYHSPDNLVCMSAHAQQCIVRKRILMTTNKNRQLAAHI